MARLHGNESGEQAAGGNVAVGATAAEVRPLRTKRVSLSLRNNGATDLFIGFSSALTAANGYPLRPGEEYVFDDYVGPVFIISATTGDLRYYEIF